MNHSTPMPENREDDNQKPALEQVLEIFKQCFNRSFSMDNEAPVSRPSPEDKPMSLDLYREAVATLEIEDQLSEQALSSHLDFIRKSSFKQLASRYPAGSKFCINIMPYFSAGVPQADLFVSRVTGLGLTSGPSSDPAYYFLNFPEEIQNQCTFYVDFQNMNFPTVTEREKLISDFQSAWNNLRKILKVSPNN